ncbi:MAG: alanine racemase [Arcanobacterium sp.]|nr:alanine racemase [Arcanobacterium sp.]
MSQERIGEHIIMVTFPRVVIDDDQIVANAERIAELGAQRGVDITAVVKGVAGYTPLIKRIAQSPVRALADASLEHVRAYADVPKEKWFIRIPMLGEIPQVVELTQMCMISDRITADRIEEYCETHNLHYSVLVMAEVGDLREGVEDNELVALTRHVESLPRVQLAGIGTNVSCYGNILPGAENMADLIAKVELVQRAIGRELEIVTGGNSSSLRMLEEGTLPPAVNNLRCGESILFGRLPCYEEDIPWLEQHPFTLETEIVELKEKPSFPWGQVGNGAAFGEEPEFEDKGRRLRALVVMGRQAMYMDGVYPLDPGVEILGAASDYTVCDVTESARTYQLGSTMEFSLDYSAVASGFTHGGMDIRLRSTLQR